MIEAKDITLSIGKKKILSHISLRIERGEFVTIAGNNGAGKSTLLKVLCGEYRKIVGHVELNGKALNSYTIAQLSEIRAVFPQVASMQFPLTVRQTILMGRIPYASGSYSRHDDTVADEVIRITELSPLTEREFPTLSGGEMQRVQFARVLAQLWDMPEQKTGFLFLDEPTNNLDMRHQHAVLSIAQELSKKNIIVIAVIHDLNLAAQYSSRIIFMKDGNIAQDGEPKKICTPECIAENLGVIVKILRHEGLQHPVIVPQSSFVNTNKEKSL